MGKPKKPGKKATKKATPKAAKKAGRRGKRDVPPPPPDQPRWGATLKVGSIGPREVTVREPLNQAAVDSMSEQDALGLVLSVLCRRLESELGEVGLLLGALKGWAADDALRKSAVTKGGG